MLVETAAHIAFTARIIPALGMPIRIQDLSPLTHRFGEYFKHGSGVVPADACVCDTDAVFQACFSFFGDFLGALGGGVS